ncbi:MAG: 2-hydroxyacid dehydrogenase [Acutalibacteraceae bacterium]|nr:2-hydroxyacid dehydrogenase [Acutalibacteraceae bacterium]
MITIGFYDAKPYDIEYFNLINEQYGFKIKYIEARLNENTAMLSCDCDAVCAFVSDDVSAVVIDRLCSVGVKLIAMRCAGYNNVDVKYAENKIPVVRVPAYSPYAVAEHAMAMLLTLNRRTHKAFLRTRDFNFSLNGLTGFDLHSKTVGIIGTGNIGSVFVDICKGFGMKVIAYDVNRTMDEVEYVELDTLFRNSDIISLHCPLNHSTYHMIDENSISKMKKNVFIVNTSRGALINSEDLLEALLDERVGGACLDVYEEEVNLFYEDNSETIIKDEILSRLIGLPNVIVTSHQGFLTREALTNIASTTLENISEFFMEGTLPNKIQYKSLKS